jgi:hypothetical protein
VWNIKTVHGQHVSRANVLNHSSSVPAASSKTLQSDKAAFCGMRSETQSWTPSWTQ